MKTTTRSFRATALALAVLGTLAAGQAGASGFQLREQSVKNLGKSNAGSIVGKDASNVSLNPAAMTNLDKNTFQADITVIDLTAKFDGGGTIFGGTPLAQPLKGGNGGDPGSPTVVPNMAAVFRMKGALEGLTLGASVGAPFGLKTDYDADWVGRYRALTSDVKVMDLTLSAALESDQGVSFGVGLIYERADVTLSKAVDFGTAICAGAAGGAANCSPLAPFPIKPQSQDGMFEVTGDGTGIGYVVGGQIKPNDKLAIGVSYRSEIKHDLKGTLDFTIPGAAATVLGARAAAYADGAGGARLVTPSIATISVSYGITDNFRVMGDYQRTGWSSLQDVTIKRDNGTVVGSEPFDWKDTSFVSIGAEYDLNDAWTLRAGIGKDETPTNDTHRTPRLPDNDRKLYSIGASWNVSESLSIDAGFQRISIDSPSINLPSTIASGGTDTATLKGGFDGHANLYGVSMQYRF